MWSTPAIKYHGLVNQGSTCYLNSVLQVLFMTKDFRDAVERHISENTDSEHIDLQLASLFGDLKSYPAYTYKITKKLGINKVYEQQDAAEYFEKILAKTSDDASKIFHGQLTHKTTCSSCRTETDAAGPFWNLTLALEDSYSQNFSVVNGIEKYFRESSLNGENRMYCEKCDDKSDATTKCVINHHPEVLMLLLKRFEFDYYSMRYVKINCTVDVPCTLQIPENQTYELYAMVEHSGDLSSGHYIATIKSEDDGRCYSFNDSCVTEANYQPFQLDQVEKSDSAYLLFYRKKKVHAADTQDTREESTQCQDGVEKTAGAGCTNAVDVSIDTNLETGVSNYVNDECRRSSDLSNSEDWPIGGYNSPNIQQECNEERKDIRYHLQDDNAEKQRDEGKMIDSDEEAMTGIAEAENQTKKTEILSRETELEESVDNQGKDSARPDGVRHRKSQEAKRECLAINKCVIKRHPEVLMLLLKRFEFDHYSNSYVKNNCTVDVPCTLQIPENQTYELYAMVEHSGDLRGGHYIATIKSEDDGKWYSFNDSWVTLLHSQPFQSDKVKKSSSAYLLFYRKEKVPAAGTQYFREESTPGGYPLSTCETQDQSPAERRKREEDEGTAEEGKYPAATAFINRDNQPQLRKEYELNSQPTGLCLIINNEHFWDGRVRHGTDKDAESLAEVFSWLGFRVLMCKDQTKDQMVRALVCFASQCDLSQLQEFNVKEWTHSRFTDLLVAPQHGDAFICCVLSHGNKGVVLGIDGQPLPIKQITRTFMATRQSPLTAKPKVFLIQACQGGQIHPRVLLNDLEADDSESTSFPQEADFFVQYATVEDPFAIRIRMEGSWNEEIEVILRSVNNEVAGKEVYEQQDAAEYFEKILAKTSDDASKVNGIEKYFRESSLNGENRMYCEKCDDKSDATTVLMLLLKRFEFDYYSMRYVKINCTVDVPCTLQIPENQLYELYAMVEHSGDLRSGHYIATIKSEHDGRWYSFNDSCVTEAVARSEDCKGRSDK
ncbi:hypothetical protein NQZ68_011929 [Dissostichus eleginoides]|nr:hypothetical protein NQZ68_011929 [Dissostichus eleginoides]